MPVVVPVPVRLERDKHVRERIQGRAKKKLPTTRPHPNFLIDFSYFCRQYPVNNNV